ncbi:alpha/beta fold hydrolase [Novosphingobium sp.]|uniref:alpha/beta fold hydrolase n=1 Tax=Novosphingobium sp. TaxID=1874826 RepID=UPI0038BE022E
MAHDHIGFGRSDMVIDPDWYSIAQHTRACRTLIEKLDLTAVMLFVQDWGGPTGLAQVAEMGERFDRLVIMNTWMPHEGHVYSSAIRNWAEAHSAQHPDRSAKRSDRHRRRQAVRDTQGLVQTNSLYLGLQRRGLHSEMGLRMGRHAPAGNVRLAAGCGALPAGIARRADRSAGARPLRRASRLTKPGHRFLT